jgi:serine/threonine-protein kinase
MIGHLISNYKILEKIGEGGMGDVFKGIDIMLERDIAIKMLRPELARQQAIVERFRAEAVTLAKLNHPNIATLYNFVRQGNDYFMVMEFVKGHTVERLLKQTGAMSYQKAVQLFAQALDGIAHAHRLGIIHRDLKPANVMMTDSGLIKVMDFGIARVLGSDRITRTGNVIGTIEYMSPEQIRGEETDARSDIYSAGILLYEMLTGRVPFECNSEYELMRRQVEDAPVPPRVFTKQIPLALEQVIMRALAKRPEARFQSADEFRVVLGNSLGVATAIRVNPSASLKGEASVQKPKPLTPSAVSHSAMATAPSKTGIAETARPTTLDFSSEPPPSSKETRPPQIANPLPETKEAPLSEAAQAVLKETRLAKEAKAAADIQQLKETRLGDQNRAQAVQRVPQQAYADYAPEDLRSAAVQQQTSPVARFIDRLNWKHYTAAMLLALLSIPVAFLASSGDNSQANRNQMGSTKHPSSMSEQRSEPAPKPAPSSTARPSTPEPATIEPPPNEAADTQENGSAGTGARKARRATARQPAQARDSNKRSGQGDAEKKRQDNDDSDKKDEKKQEKKGGLFDKVKGGLKKINPFKKG